MMAHFRTPQMALDPGSERGSVSIWVATASVVMIMLVGLVVDLGGQVHAQQMARSVAAEAARAGGQQIATGSALRGETVRLNPTAAVAAAQTYLAAAGVSGSASVRDGTVVVVTSTTTYPTKFLSIIGISSLTTSGSAESQVVRSVGGVQR